jgi:hypothetical protein
MISWQSVVFILSYVSNHSRLQEDPAQSPTLRGPGWNLFSFLVIEYQTPSVFLLWPHHDHNNGSSISLELEDPPDSNTPAQQEPWCFPNQIMAVFFRQLRRDLKPYYRRSRTAAWKLYIHKPVAIDKLAAYIREKLANGRISSPAGTPILFKFVPKKDGSMRCNSASITDRGFRSLPRIGTLFWIDGPIGQYFVWSWAFVMLTIGSGSDSQDFQ